LILRKHCQSLELGLVHYVVFAFIRIQCFPQINRTLG
jgi:hypothetical protein